MTSPSLTALAAALALLGISPVYHAPEVPRNTHALLWCRALEAAAGTDPGVPSWDRFKFDQLLSGHQAAGDFPASVLAEDLAKAYPAASIILTARDEDDWVRSMNETVVARARPSSSQQQQQQQHSHEDQAPMAVLARAFHRYSWDDDFETHGRNRFREHNAKVRKLAKTRRFLEYRPEEGWAPLYDFLELPVPQGTPFPLVDDWAG